MFDIPLSVPSLKGNEWQYIKECLDTEWVSSAGKYVDLFEQNTGHRRRWFYRFPLIQVPL